MVTLGQKTFEPRGNQLISAVLMGTASPAPHSDRTGLLHDSVLCPIRRQSDGHVSLTWAVPFTFGGQGGDSALGKTSTYDLEKRIYPNRRGHVVISISNPLFGIIKP